MIIAECGSCHDGDFKKAKTLVKIARDAGADACKFQLLEPVQLQGGNIEFPWEWLPELMDEGIEVFASAFSMRGVGYMAECGCKSIKFAYSTQYLTPFIKAVNEERKEYMDNPFTTVYRSCGVMDEKKNWAKNLFCLPMYPVPYEINFEGLFPKFEGFSDHSMGTKQTIKAIKAGAKIVEVHMKSPWGSDCPDYRFAKTSKEVEKICKATSRKIT